MTIYELPPTPEGVAPEDWRAAIAAIRSYCGWHIAPSVTETLTLDGSGDGLLLVQTLRLTAVTGVTLDGSTVDPGGLLWGRRGVIRFEDYRRWTRGYDNVTVSVTHGYEEFPHELLAVARSMAAAGSGSLATRLTSGPHSMEMSPEAAAGAFAMSPLHRYTLDRYRVMGRP